MDASTFRSKEFFSKFQEAIDEISRGGNVWENNNSHGMLEFRRYAKHNWLTIPSNTQLVERWVKDANECTFNSKDETLSNAIAILRSTTIFRMRELALNELRTTELHANQHQTKGVAGEQMNKATGEIEVSGKIQNHDN